MRLFIAIDFPETIKENLVKIQDDLHKSSQSGNFSRPENLHLTLVFLGEVPASKIGKIKSVMNSIRINPFTLCFEGGGNFGKIHWIGVKQNPALLELQKNLTKGLRDVGFAIENRPYKPHITIAREVTLKQKYSFNFMPFDVDVNSFVLMKSERIGGKLTYTKVYEKIL